MINASRYIIKVIRVTDKEWYYIKSNEMWSTDRLTKNKDEAFRYTESDARADAAAINFNGHYKANLIKITPSASAMMQRNFHARQRIKTIMAKGNAHFITLTQDPKLYDATDVKLMRQAVKNTLRGMSNTYYYCVFEQHKKGNWHAHIIADEPTTGMIIQRWKRGFYFDEIVHAGFISKNGKYIHIENELIKYVGKNTAYTKPMFSRSIEREIQARKEVKLNNELGWMDHYASQKRYEARQIWERRK